MGQPGRCNDLSSLLLEKSTRGTETSKYPEEKKVKNDSRSSGERNGMSLKPMDVIDYSRYPCGGCGIFIHTPVSVWESYKTK